jgi:hypothetical protein
LFVAHGFQGAQPLALLQVALIVPPLMVMVPPFPSMQPPPMPAPV